MFRVMGGSRDVVGTLKTLRGIFIELSEYAYSGGDEVSRRCTALRACFDEVINAYSAEPPVTDAEARLLGELDREKEFSDERVRIAKDLQRASITAVAEEMLAAITSGRKASIGSINNTYCPQISVEQVERWRATLR